MCDVTGTKCPMLYMPLLQPSLHPRDKIIDYMVSETHSESINGNSLLSYLRKNFKSSKNSHHPGIQSSFVSFLGWRMAKSRIES